MLKTRIALLVVPVLMAGSFGVAGAQDRDRDNRGNGGFYNGVRDGGSNGSYDQEVHPHYNRRYRQNYNNNGYNNNGYNNGQYNNGYNNRGQYNHGDYRPYRRQQGGIGPGKGALIGGAGGAVLGALFGHGLGSTLIGGAAGAGIGAVVGKVHQDRQRDENGNYYPQ